MADTTNNIDIKINANADDAVKTIGDLKSSIDALTQTNQKLADGFQQSSKKISDSLEKNTKAVEGLSEHVEGFSKNLTKLGGSIPIVSEAFEILNTILALNPLGLLVATIGLLIGGFMSLEAVTEPIENALAGVATAAKVVFENFSNVNEIIKDIINWDFSKLKKDTKDLGKVVGDAYSAGKSAAEEQHELNRKLADDTVILAQKEQDLAALKEKARVKDKDQRKNQQAVIDKEKEITDIKQENADKQLDILKKQYDHELKNNGKYNEDHLKQIKDAEAKTIQIKTEGINATRRETVAMSNEELADQKKAAAEHQKIQKQIQKLDIEAIDDARDRLIAEGKAKLDEVKGNSKDEIELRLAIKKANARKLADFDKKQKDKWDKEDAKRLKEIKKASDQARIIKEENIVAESKNETDAIKNQIEETKKKYDAEIKEAGNNKDKIAEIEAEKVKELASLREVEKSDIETQIQKEIDLNNTKTQIAIQNAKDKANEEMAQEGITADEKAAIEQNLNDIKSDLNQKLYDQNVKLTQQANKQIADLDAQSTADKIENSKKVKEAREQDEKDTFEVAKGLMSALNSISDLMTELDSQRTNQSLAQKNAAAKKEFNMKKGLGIVSAAINTAEGITKALENPFPLNIIMAAVNGAMGAVQIATIAAKKFTPESPSSSGGSVTQPSSSSGASQFNPSSFQGLGQSTLQNQNALPPQKVYVSEQDISSTQQKVSVIQGRSVLGG